MSRLICCGLIVCFDTIVALAAGVVSVPFVPNGLSRGDTYQIAFVTAGTRDATSGNIGQYNRFARDQAALAGAMTETWHVNWFAIGSTPVRDARDNALVSAPVYLLDGSLVATGFADMWDGSIANPIQRDQFMQLAVDNAVWTGSDSDGTEMRVASPQGSISFGLGTTFGTGIVWAGDAFDTSDWIDKSSLSAPQTRQRALYAISEVLTVVPEPSAALACFGIAAVLLARRRCDRDRKPKYTVR